MTTNIYMKAVGGECLQSYAQWNVILYKAGLPPPTMHTHNRTW